MVSFVDVMHGIEEQASLAFGIKANVVHRVVPLLVIPI
jgi:hypothetical protein